MANPELSPQHPLERFYGYQVTRRLYENPQIPTTPPPDASGKRDATRADVERHFQNLNSHRPGR